MPGDAKNREATKKGRKTGVTRRRVLGTVMGVGVSGMLAERAEARVRRLTAAADPHDVFRKAWTAFSTLDGNTLWAQLDPNMCDLYRIRDGKPIKSGRQDVWNQLVLLWPLGLGGATFTPNTQHWNAANTKVTGKASWTDNDGSQPDPNLSYEFRFDPNSGLMTYLWAKHH